jgi:hypothetical protein
MIFRVLARRLSGGLPSQLCGWFDISGFRDKGFAYTA